MTQKWYFKLHWQIMIAMGLGLIFASLAVNFGWHEFNQSWIAPWGKIFMNALKAIALPLVLTSLISGVASLSDVKKLSSMGGKTIGIYLMTTALAVIIGLVMGNIFKPGSSLPPELQDRLQASYQKQVDSKKAATQEVKKRGPLTPLVEMIPNNILSSLSNNRNMLQVVFLSILIGMCLVAVGKEAQPLTQLIHAASLVVLKIVDFIMYLAPIGVFSLISTTLINLSAGGDSSLFELLQSLGLYCLVVLAGLAIHTTVVYPFILKVMTKRDIKEFFKGVFPAQLLAFSTSSSAATLPVTMEISEKELNNSEETSAFVLPLGATINMDGTALYQAIAALFIAQATGVDLTLMQQLSIVATATMASVGTAAVPGAGIIMLVVILESVNLPASGIALILGVDRILDMARTAVNVTGDLTVATIIDDGLKKS